MRNDRMIRPKSAAACTSANDRLFECLFGKKIRQATSKVPAYGVTCLTCAASGLQVCFLYPSRFDTTQPLQQDSSSQEQVPLFSGMIVDHHLL